MSTERVRATLPGGAIVWVEAATVGADKEREVTLDLSKALPLDGVSKVIAGLAKLVHSGIEDLKPKKTTAEFSLEISLESGQLTALWVKGSGNASIKLTLEWS
jgi:hypothetical protein